MNTINSRRSVGTILVTGFGPFGGEKHNPSEAVARGLDGRVIAGRRVVGAVLPCEFGASRAELLRLLRLHQPEVTICLGLAAGRREITPERVALNLDDARIADNAGAQPRDRPVVAGGPVAYWSTLPVKAMVAELRKQGWPAAVSHTAGTFVCNHVFFGLMHALRRRSGRGGFVHLPQATEWAGPGIPGLPLADPTAAVARLIAVAARTPRDRRSVGGTLH